MKVVFSITGLLIIGIIVFAVLFTGWMSQREGDIRNHCHSLGGLVHWIYGLNHLCVKDGLIINDNL